METREQICRKIIDKLIANGHEAAAAKIAQAITSPTGELELFPLNNQLDSFIYAAFAIVGGLSYDKQTENGYIFNTRIEPEPEQDNHPRTVRIRIGNITNNTRNDGLLWELKKDADINPGDELTALYFPLNNSCHFDIHQVHCVAWVGQTCEII